MSDLVEIGRNLVLLRKWQALTQEEVASRSNRCVQCLQAIEYGHDNATIDTLIQFSGTLGADFRVLGVFSRTDNEILSEFRQAPLLPQRNGGVLQICGNICLLRKKQKMTQKQLAQRSGVSDARLRDIEHGCANARIHTFVDIAEAFGLSLMKLNLLSMPEDMLMELVCRARMMAGIR